MNAIFIIYISGAVILFQKAASQHQKLPLNTWIMLEQLGGLFLFCWGFLLWKQIQYTLKKNRKKPTQPYMEPRISYISVNFKGLSSVHKHKKVQS